MISQKRSNEIRRTIAEQQAANDHDGIYITASVLVEVIRNMEQSLAWYAVQVDRLARDAAQIRDDQPYYGGEPE